MYGLALSGHGAWDGWKDEGGGAEEWSLQVHAALCAVPLFQLSTSFASAHTLNPSVSPFFFTLVLLLLFVRLAEVWNILRGSTGNVAAARIKGEDTQTLMSRSDKRTRGDCRVLFLPLDWGARERYVSLSLVDVGRLLVAASALSLRPAASRCLGHRVFSEK